MIIIFITAFKCSDKTNKVRNLEGKLETAQLSEQNISTLAPVRFPTIRF